MYSRRAFASPPRTDKPWPAATISGETSHRCPAVRPPQLRSHGPESNRVPQCHVVPPAFAAGFPHWRQQLTRDFPIHLRRQTGNGIRTRRSMYSRRHSPATTKEPTKDEETETFFRCSPSGIRPRFSKRAQPTGWQAVRVTQMTTASIRATQWSASSCPEANAEITSNT